jgi:hypothetical protein
MSTLEFIPSGLYNLSYYPLYPTPNCTSPDDVYTSDVRINGVCTNLAGIADIITDTSASSGNCPVFNQQVGSKCLPTNMTMTTPYPGSFPVGSQMAQLGPLYPPQNQCSSS